MPLCKRNSIVVCVSYGTAETILQDTTRVCACCSWIPRLLHVYSKEQTWRVRELNPEASCATSWPTKAQMSRLMTKPTKWHVCLAKTQISLGIRPVWPESSLCAQLVAKDPSFLHADSEDSDQTGRMPRLIWVFAGRICHFVGFVMRRLICLCRYRRDKDKFLDHIITVGENWL